MESALHTSLPLPLDCICPAVLCSLAQFCYVQATDEVAATWQRCAEPSANGSGPPQDEGCDAGDLAKKERALKKKLRQLEQLRDKDPSSLSDEQKQKLAGQAQLVAELKAISTN